MPDRGEVRTVYASGVGRSVRGAAVLVLIALASSFAYADTEEKEDWVIYATGPGWLRFGPRAEFASEQKSSAEIWGGQSDAPLQKTLLAEGFEDRQAVLDYLCPRLTKVHLRFNALVPPYEVVYAIFGEGEYALRLSRGNDPDAVLFRQDEYALSDEKAILTEYGITPRFGIGKRWLVHATGHGTRDGPVADDAWMAIGSQPLPNPKVPGSYYFVIADGIGGTFTYSADKFEGPYCDSYGISRAMLRLGVSTLQLSRGSRHTREIIASELPEEPRDYGSRALGVQVIVAPVEMRDWVVYVTGERYLHIGTRKEFEAPVKRSETIGFGLGEELVQKEILDLGRPFIAYDQALWTLRGHLRDVKVGFHALSQPRETVDATVMGRELTLHLARNPEIMVAGYRGYNSAAEIRLMLENGIVPKKYFGKQWLVHATGHGTYSGPVVDDHWMMVGSAPQGGRVVIPDGLGGTFTYSVDQPAGPFEDSVTLAKALEQRGLKSIRIYAQDRSVSADEAYAAAEPPTERRPRILSITPDRGSPGQSFYVTVIAEGARPWYEFELAQGVEVTNETYLGVNPDGPGEIFLATVDVAEDAPLTGE